MRGLSPKIGEILAHVGFSIECSRGLSDEVLIPKWGERAQTWITKDDRAKSSMKPQ